MMFSYVSYNYKKIYFRRGAFIGQGRDANRQPLLESFVLFNKKLKPTNANDEYKKGFLLLYDKEFHVEQGVLETLCQSDDNVRKLFNEKKFNIQPSLQAYYTINESTVLDSKTSSITQTEKVRALQVLKAKAVEPTRVYYPEIDYFSEFSKKMPKIKEPTNK